MGDDTKGATGPDGHYDERTLVLWDNTEVFGQDGYRWYTYAGDAARVAHLLNFDGDGDHPEPRMRQGRPMVEVMPGKANTTFSELTNVRMDDFLFVGFHLDEDVSDEPEVDGEGTSPSP